VKLLPWQLGGLLAFPPTLNYASLFFLFLPNCSGCCLLPVCASPTLRLSSRLLLRVSCWMVPPALGTGRRAVRSEAEVQSHQRGAWPCSQWHDLAVSAPARGRSTSLRSYAFLACNPCRSCAASTSDPSASSVRTELNKNNVPLPFSFWGLFACNPPVVTLNVRPAPRAGDGQMRSAGQDPARGQTPESGVANDAHGSKKLRVLSVRSRAPPAPLRPLRTARIPKDPSCKSHLKSEHGSATWHVKCVQQPRWIRAITK